jgi:glucose-6-phosphate dehydrogenase assembly protein OpcA
LGKEFMPTDESVAAFLNGESRAVAVEAIQNELDRLWEAAANQTPAVSRACQINLLVYSPHEGAYERAAATLTELARRQTTCRAIVVLAEADTTDEETSAYISAHFHPGASGEEKVGCEQIAVIARGSAVDKLPAIVTPLLADGLPTVLWWQGDLPEDNVLFEKLLTASPHLIFDARYGHDVGNTFSRARALSLNWKTPQGESGLASDLTWLSLAPYRDLIAQFLDSPLGQPALHAVQEVTIEVMAATEGDVHFAEPFLLLGWLASRLHWKLNEPLTQAAESVFQTNWQAHDKKEVVGNIVLHKSAPETSEAVHPGDFVALQMRSHPDGGSLLFSLQRDWNQPQIRLRVTQGEQNVAESAEALRDVSAAGLLVQALAQTGQDQVYNDALRIATQLI